VQNAKGEELMYFEVSMDKYLNGAGSQGTPASDR
jgi:hypothetical protein